MKVSCTPEHKMSTTCDELSFQIQHNCTLIQQCSTPQVQLSCTLSPFFAFGVRMQNPASPCLNAVNFALNNLTGRSILCKSMLIRSHTKLLCGKSSSPCNLVNVAYATGNKRECDQRKHRVLQILNLWCRDDGEWLITCNEASFQIQRKCRVMPISSSDNPVQLSCANRLSTVNIDATNSTCGVAAASTTTSQSTTGTAIMISKILSTMPALDTSITKMTTPKFTMTFTTSSKIPYTDQAGQESHSSNTATLMGGIVGGVLGGVFITVAIVVVWWICKRSNRKGGDSKEDSHMHTGLTSPGGPVPSAPFVPDVINVSVTEDTSTNDYQVIPDGNTFQMEMLETKFRSGTGYSHPGVYNTAHGTSSYGDYTDIKDEELDGVDGYFLGKAFPQLVSSADHVNQGSKPHNNEEIQDMYNRLGIHFELSKGSDTYNRIGDSKTAEDPSLPSADNNGNQDTYNKLGAKEVTSDQKLAIYNRLGEAESNHSPSGHQIDIGQEVSTSDYFILEKADDSDNYNRLGDLNSEVATQAKKDTYDRIGDVAPHTAESGPTQPSPEYFVLEDVDTEGKPLKTSDDYNGLDGVTKGTSDAQTS